MRGSGSPSASFGSAESSPFELAGARAAVRFCPVNARVGISASVGLSVVVRTGLGVDVALGVCVLVSARIFISTGVLLVSAGIGLAVLVPVVPTVREVGHRVEARGS